MDVSSTEPSNAILKAAARLIVELGNKEVDISVLAKQAGVKRATIYATFGGRGKAESVRDVIYRSILTEFLREAGKSIKLALGIVDQQTPTAGEQLAAILRATLIAFKENELYGKVVLQELSLRQTQENAIIRPIFKNVDKVIAKARAAKELSEIAPPHDWQVRQVLFVLTRGLLRTLYLEQFDDKGKPFDKPLLTQEDIEIEILQLLRLYSREASQIDTIIEALYKRKKKSSTASESSTR